MAASPATPLLTKTLKHPDGPSTPLEISTSGHPTSGSSGYISLGERDFPELNRRNGLFSGIRNDFNARWREYKSDWQVINPQLLGSATYIFFASIIPALAFGEQIYEDTGGMFGGAQVVLATTIGGMIQSLFGGQPMLIVGVAEPIVLVYIYMYRFASKHDIPYREWCTVSLLWASLMILILAAVNSCSYIHRFTAFSGELFGLLIAVLFLQEGFKGIVDEFNVGETSAEHHLSGFWSLILAFGLIFTCFVLRSARSWTLFNGTIRGALADYATALMVLTWTLISFIPTTLPENIPLRMTYGDVLDRNTRDSWYTIDRLDTLSTWHVFAALVPGLIITFLFYFDHNVSAMLAQQDSFGLKKPNAYHWDFFLLGIITAICACCGIPPINGVLPQAPLHTKSCIDLKSTDKVRVQEQRWTNFIQSFLCGVCLFIVTPMRKIPRSVLWGFFIFMGLESLDGSQFWDRLKIFITDRKLLRKFTDTDHALYLETVPVNVVNMFTLIQFVSFMACYGVTWSGAAGISFPILICLLVPVRAYILPDLFDKEHLSALDPDSENASNRVPEQPLPGSIAEKALKQERIEPKVIDDVMRSGGMYGQGVRNVPSRAIDTALINRLLVASRVDGKITAEELDIIQKTTLELASMELDASNV